MTLRTTLLLLGALFLGACSDSTGGGGETPLSPGTFQATHSGDVAAAAQGSAVFATGYDGEGKQTVRVLLTDSRVPAQTTQVILNSRVQTVVGTHQVGRVATGTPYVGSFYVFDFATEDVSLYAPLESGTVTIQEITPQIVRGSYDVTARTNPAFGPVKTIRSIGRFTAVPAPAS